jgi:hypothetical protein
MADMATDDGTKKYPPEGGEGARKKPGGSTTCARSSLRGLPCTLLVQGHIHAELAVRDLLDYEGSAQRNHITPAGDSALCDTGTGRAQGVGHFLLGPEVGQNVGFSHFPSSLAQLF